MAGSQALHDPILSSLGRRQAKMTAAALSGEPIDTLISSPLRRAIQTAEPLAELTGLKVISDSGMAEVDHDGAKYVSVELWRKQNSDEWRNFLDDPVGALGGNHEVFITRVKQALSKIMDHPGRRIAVFTHGLPINLSLSLALGEGSLARFAPRHASITRMAGSSIEDLKLLSFNEVAHITAQRT